MYKEKDNSKLAYYITIDLELFPGKSIPPEELKNLKCNNKWNAVRKAYSEFIGKPYKISPVYNKTVKNKKENNKINYNYRPNQRENIFNRTRRNIYR
jgi:hypothetical protein